MHNTCNTPVLFLLGQAGNVPDFTGLWQPCVTDIRASNCMKDMGHDRVVLGIENITHSKALLLLVFFQACRWFETCMIRL